MIRQLVTIAAASSLVGACGSAPEGRSGQQRDHRVSESRRGATGAPSVASPVLLLSPQAPGDPVVALLEVRHVGSSWRARWAEVSSGRVGPMHRDGGSCSGVRRKAGMSAADVERMRRVVDAACGRPPAGGMARARGTEADLVKLAERAAPEITPGDGPREYRPERPRGTVRPAT